MLSRRRMGFAGLVFLLSAVSMAGIGWVRQETANQTPDELLPSGTLLYAHWAGIEPQRRAYENTALHDVLQDTSLGQFITHVARQIAGASGNKVPPAAWELLDEIIHYGVTVSFSLDGMWQPAPRLVAVFPDGASAVRFGKLDQSLRTLVPGRVEQLELEGRTVWQVSGFGSPKIAWWVEGSHMVLTIAQTGPEPVIAVASGKKPNIASQATYQAHQPAARHKPILHIWADTQKAMSLAAKMVPREIPHKLGLDGFKSIAYSVAFQGRALRSELRIDAPAPRRGILKVLLDQPKVSFSDLPALPENLNGFFLLGCDWAGTFDNVVELIHSVPDGPSDAEIQQALAMVDQILGVRLRDDLLASLGNKLAVFSTSGGALPGVSTVLALEVQNRQVLQRETARLADRIQQLVGGQLEVSTKQVGDVEIRMFQASPTGNAAVPFLPSLAVTDRWLVIGLLPQVIEDFIQCQSGQLPSWKPAETFAQSRGDIPTEGIWIGWNDPRPRVQMVLGLAPIIVQAISSQVPIQLDASLLPTANQVNQYLFPSHTAATVDGRGMRWVGTSALPVLSAGGPDSIGALAAISVSAAVLIPAVQQARVGQAIQKESMLDRDGPALENPNQMIHRLPKLLTKP